MIKNTKLFHLQDKCLNSLSSVLLIFANHAVLFHIFRLFQFETLQGFKRSDDTDFFPNIRNQQRLGSRPVSHICEQIAYSWSDRNPELHDFFICDVLVLLDFLRRYIFVTCLILNFLRRYVFIFCRSAKTATEVFHPTGLSALL